MSAVRQFILNFAQAPHYAAADFVGALSNREATAWLERPQTWPNGRLMLIGPEGCGKTHLLHIWAAGQGAEIRSGPALRGLPATPSGALAIDDADEIRDEAALFHLLNQAQANGTLLLLTARRAPAQWGVRLPDLLSRLRAMATATIGEPDDELLRRLLVRLASDRQLIMPSGVAEYLLARLPRTQAALREAVARLDRAALAEGRRLTRPLAARIISELIISELTGAELMGAELTASRAAEQIEPDRDSPMIFDSLPFLPLTGAVNPDRSIP